MNNKVNNIEDTFSEGPIEDNVIPLFEEKIQLDFYDIKKYAQEYISKNGESSANKIIEEAAIVLSQRIEGLLSEGLDIQKAANQINNADDESTISRIIKGYSNEFIIGLFAAYKTLVSNEYGILDKLTVSFVILYFILGPGFMGTIQIEPITYFAGLDDLILMNVIRLISGIVGSGYDKEYNKIVNTINQEEYRNISPILTVQSIYYDSPVTERPQEQITFQERQEVEQPRKPYESSGISFKQARAITREFLKSFITDYRNDKIKKSERYSKDWAKRELRVLIRYIKKYSEEKNESLFKESVRKFINTLTSEDYYEQNDIFMKYHNFIEPLREYCGDGLPEDTFYDEGFNFDIEETRAVPGKRNKKERQKQRVAPSGDQETDSFEGEENTVPSRSISKSISFRGETSESEQRSEEEVSGEDNREFFRANENITSEEEERERTEEKINNTVEKTNPAIQQDADEYKESLFSLIPENADARDSKMKSLEEVISAYKIYKLLGGQKNIDNMQEILRSSIQTFNDAFNVKAMDKNYFPHFFKLQTELLVFKYEFGKIYLDQFFKDPKTKKKSGDIKLFKSSYNDNIDVSNTFKDFFEKYEDGKNKSYLFYKARGKAKEEGKLPEGGTLDEIKTLSNISEAFINRIKTLIFSMQKIKNIFSYDKEFLVNKDFSVYGDKKSIKQLSPADKYEAISFIFKRTLMGTYKRGGKSKLHFFDSLSRNVNKAKTAATNLKEVDEKVSKFLSDNEEIINLLGLGEIERSEPISISKDEDSQSVEQTFSENQEGSQSVEQIFSGNEEDSKSESEEISEQVLNENTEAVYVETDPQEQKSEETGEVIADIRNPIYSYDGDDELNNSIVSHGEKMRDILTSNKMTYNSAKDLTVIFVKIMNEFKKFTSIEGHLRGANDTLKYLIEYSETKSNHVIKNDLKGKGSRFDLVKKGMLTVINIVYAHEKSKSKYIAKKLGIEAEQVKALARVMNDVYETFKKYDQSDLVSKISSPRGLQVTYEKVEVLNYYKKFDISELLGKEPPLDAADIKDFYMFFLKSFYDPEVYRDNLGLLEDKAFSTFIKNIYRQAAKEKGPNYSKKTYQNLIKEFSENLSKIKGIDESVKLFHEKFQEPHEGGELNDFVVNYTPKRKDNKEDGEETYSENNKVIEDQEHTSGLTDIESKFLQSINVTAEEYNSNWEAYEDEIVIGPDLKALVNRRGIGIKKGDYYEVTEIYEKDGEVFYEIRNLKTDSEHRLSYFGAAFFFEDFDIDDEDSKFFNEENSESVEQTFSEESQKQDGLSFINSMNLTSLLDKKSDDSKKGFVEGGKYLEKYNLMKVFSTYLVERISGVAEIKEANAKYFLLERKNKGLETEKKRSESLRLRNKSLPKAQLPSLPREEQNDFLSNNIKRIDKEIKENQKKIDKLKSSGMIQNTITSKYSESQRAKKYERMVYDLKEKINTIGVEEGVGENASFVFDTDSMSAIDDLFESEDLEFRKLLSAAKENPRSVLGYTLDYKSEKYDQIKGIRKEIDELKKRKRTGNLETIRDLERQILTLKEDSDYGEIEDVQRAISTFSKKEESITREKIDKKRISFDLIKKSSGDYIESVEKLLSPTPADRVVWLSAESIAKQYSEADIEEFDQENWEVEVSVNQRLAENFKSNFSSFLNQDIDKDGEGFERDLILNSLKFLSRILNKTENKDIFDNLFGRTKTQIREEYGYELESLKNLKTELMNIWGKTFSNPEKRIKDYVSKNYSGDSSYLINDLRQLNEDVMNHDVRTDLPLEFVQKYEKQDYISAFQEILGSPSISEDEGQSKLLKTLNISKEEFDQNISNYIGQIKNTEVYELETGDGPEIIEGLKRDRSGKGLYYPMRSVQNRADIFNFYVEKPSELFEYYDIAGSETQEIDPLAEQFLSVVTDKINNIDEMEKQDLLELRSIIVGKRLRDKDTGEVLSVSEEGFYDKIFSEEKDENFYNKHWTYFAKFEESLDVISELCRLLYSKAYPENKYMEKSIFSIPKLDVFNKLVGYLKSKGSKELSGDNSKNYKRHSIIKKYIDTASINFADLKRVENMVSKEDLYLNVTAIMESNIFRANRALKALNKIYRLSRRDVTLNQFDEYSKRRDNDPSYAEDLKNLMLYIGSIFTKENLKKYISRGILDQVEAEQLELPQVDRSVLLRLSHKSKLKDDKKLTKEERKAKKTEQRTLEYKERQAKKAKENKEKQINSAGAQDDEISISEEEQGSVSTFNEDPSVELSGDAKSLEDKLNHVGTSKGFQDTLNKFKPKDTNKERDRFFKKIEKMKEKMTPEQISISDANVKRMAGDPNLGVYLVENGKGYYGYWQDKYDSANERSWFEKADKSEESSSESSNNLGLFSSRLGDKKYKSRVGEDEEFSEPNSDELRKLEREGLDYDDIFSEEKSVDEQEVFSESPKNNSDIKSKDIDSDEEVKMLKEMKEVIYFLFKNENQDLQDLINYQINEYEDLPFSVEHFTKEMFRMVDNSENKDSTDLKDDIEELYTSGQYLDVVEFIRTDEEVSNLLKRKKELLEPYPLVKSLFTGEEISQEPIEPDNVQVYDSDLDFGEENDMFSEISDVYFFFNENEDEALQKIINEEINAYDNIPTSLETFNKSMEEVFDKKDSGEYKSGTVKKIYKSQEFKDLYNLITTDKFSEILKYLKKNWEQSLEPYTTLGDYFKSKFKQKKSFETLDVNKLIKISDKLFESGFYKESERLDSLIEKMIS